MYLFDEYLGKRVVINTCTGTFKGTLIDHDYHDSIHLFSYGHYPRCLLSTSEGIIEIPDEDIQTIQCY